MGGGLIQLVSAGASGLGPLYLFGNPEHSFFKAAYRRHTNFALETIPQDLRDGVCTVSRNGDLLGRTYLEVRLPAVKGKGVRWVRDVGHALIKNATLEIGGQLIEQHSGEWMHLWNDLSMENQAGLARMAGAESDEPADEIPEQTLFVPLQFSYCNNYASALPLICLRFHEVKIRLDLHAFEEVLEYDELHVIFACEKPRVLIDYVFLDTDERREFAQTAHEYLMTQTQEISFEKQTGSVKLDLRDLDLECKELVFVCRSEGAPPFDFTVAGRNPVRSALLKLNGHDRFGRMPGKYFNVLQPYQHHTRVPATGVNVYSFALHPEDREPSGSCNMSRIDNAFFYLDLEDGEYTVHVYALSVNVLRVMSGMAACAYSSNHPATSKARVSAGSAF